MKNQTIAQRLVSRLQSHLGKHTQIARECGIGQSTISRIARGEVSPTLAVAEPIIAWLDKHDAGIKVRSVALPAAPGLGQKGKKAHAKQRQKRDFKPSAHVHG